MSSPKFRNSSNSSINHRNLILNFAPIHFDDAELSVGIIPYEDKDQLRILRQAHSDTHFFHRDGSHVLSVAIATDVLPIGDQFTQIRLADKLYLTNALVRNALINFLYSLERRIIKYDPIEFVADSQKDNLLTKICPSDLQVPNWLSICLRYIAAIRIDSFDHQPMALGLVLNVCTKRWIELPCDLLIEKGISLIGLYVSELVQQSDPRMAPYLRLLGQVQSVEGEHLRLTDVRENVETVLASDVFFGTTRRSFQALS